MAERIINESDDNEPSSILKASEDELDPISPICGDVCRDSYTTSSWKEKERSILSSMTTFIDLDGPVEAAEHSHKC